MADELAAAVLRGAVEEARALLEAGADVKACAPQYPDVWNYSFDFRPAPLLHVAALMGNAPMVKLLLEHGAEVNEHPMIEHHYQTHDDSYEVAGDSALTMAARLGFLEVVKVLVEGGADLAAQNGAATRAATRGQHRKVVEFLKAAAKERRRAALRQPGG